MKKICEFCLKVKNDFCCFTVELKTIAKITKNKQNSQYLKMKKIFEKNKKNKTYLRRITGACQYCNEKQTLDCCGKREKDVKKQAVKTLKKQRQYRKMEETFGARFAKSVTKDYDDEFVNSYAKDLRELAIFASPE